MPVWEYVKRLTATLLWPSKAPRVGNPRLAAGPKRACECLILWQAHRACATPGVSGSSWCRVGVASAPAHAVSD
jgi:hypothetical protein